MYCNGIEIVYKYVIEIPRPRVYPCAVTRLSVQEIERRIFQCTHRMEYTLNENI